MAIQVCLRTISGHKHAIHIIEKVFTFFSVSEIQTVEWKQLVPNCSKVFDPDTDG